ncbi:hypothetical protein TRFO_16904 [Tritrichomonas foetus]|uniref:Uncharacterized protein n=1 Tax=Tritrichomonas foetus TaxID=1144522 RepID=A0A1J4KPB9_9EUKA|nr:hypothetical protein TRFO_16904 [Tritrichomonas foetus]|eukprot:OHT13135.1 hypothetical protein TRFO_16904 [Tritrichomonas foetus]
MLFMVSYLFFKEWKPIVCNCKRPDYGQLPLTPPPSPPPPQPLQTFIPPTPLPPTTFIPPSQSRRSSSSSTSSLRTEFSD